MIEVYVTEPAAINIEQLRALLPGSEYDVTSGSPQLSDDFSSPAHSLFIRSGTEADAAFLEHFPQLHAVVRVGVGLDNVDIDFCKQHGIAVYNAPGANADAVAEYVTAMILYVRRKLYELDDQAVKNWDRFRFMGTSMSEQTVGIVGFGNIGRRLQAKLAGLGCTQFLAYDPYLTDDVIEQAGAKPCDLDTLLAQADIISMHLPLTPETEYLINAEKLATLKPNALLINSSRGGVVDEAAVLALPPERNIVYVADTVENEPQVNEALLHNPRIIVTPHIASLTTASDAAMLKTATENYLNSKPANI